MERSVEKKQKLRWSKYDGGGDMEGTWTITKPSERLRLDLGTPCSSPIQNERAPR